MNFYDEWRKCIDEEINDEYYINSFLCFSKESVEPFEKSNNNDLMRAIVFLCELNKQKIIDNIDIKDIKVIQSKDIVQFSNFDNCTEELTTILSCELEGLTFEELGKRLQGSSSKGAATKYGENQAKTAKIFSLVRFVDAKPTVVINTELGNVFAGLQNDVKQKLLEILCLRDPVVKFLIARAKIGIVKYNEVTYSISDETAKRRKSNVSYLVRLALGDNKLIENIIYD